MKSEVAIPDLKIEGKGEILFPELTDSMLDQMMTRADLVEDQVIKTDLFLLILEVRRLRSENQCQNQRQG